MWYVTHCIDIKQRCPSTLSWSYMSPSLHPEASLADVKDFRLSSTFIHILNELRSNKNVKNRNKHVNVYGYNITTLGCFCKQVGVIMLGHDCGLFGCRPNCTKHTVVRL